MDKAAIPNLIHRLTGFSVPNRELDARIYAWDLNCTVVRVGCHIVAKSRDPPYHDTVIGSMVQFDGKEHFVLMMTVPWFSSSLDAATDLIKTRLPGWHWEAAADCTALVRDPNVPLANSDHVCWSANTPAAALLKAMFNAILAQKEVVTSDK